jgi:uncharacterized repeat protein (TIGR01451 family)
LAVGLIAFCVIGVAPAVAAGGASTGSATSALSAAHVGHSAVAPRPQVVSLTAPKLGSLVKEITFSKSCKKATGQTKPIGVGIEYALGNLWYTCFGVNPDLFEASAKTGKVIKSWSLNGGLGALAYDFVRHGFWAGWGNRVDTGKIYFLTVGQGGSITKKVAFTVASQYALTNIDDGLAYDGATDLIYAKADTDTVIHVFTPSGSHVSDFTWAGSCTQAGGFPGYNSGLAVGGQLLYEGGDGCSHVWVVDKVSHAPSFDFSTKVGSQGVRDEDLGCDNQTFGEDVMWSKDAYTPLAFAFLIPPNSCGAGGQPASVVIAKSAKETGSSITFSIAYTNNGAGKATGVHIDDPISGGTTLQSTVVGACLKAFANGILSFKCGTLAPGASGIVSTTVRLAKSVLDGTAIANCATVFYSDTLKKSHSSHSCVTLIVKRK